MSTFLRRLRARMPSARAAATGEAGFTLIEMLVAMLIALAIIIPVTAVLVTTQNHAGGDITRADTVQVDNVGLRSMDQELRQAYQLEFPTSTVNVGCPVVSGVQACNAIDILERLGSADYEVRYDCTVASATVPADRECVRFLCSASAATSLIVSTCIAASPNLQSRQVVIDPIVNGTSADPVFSLCYPSSSGTGCATGGTRATSGTVTIKAPSTANQATSNGGDPSAIVLTDGVYFPNLDYSQ